MTRKEQRVVWAASLKEYGAQALELKVQGYLSMLLTSNLALELPQHVSAEGLSQLAGLLLTNIETGELPLLGALRTMN
ncbi:hypothetical protein ACV356_20420 [Pseudomonas aeruginosa]